VLILQFPKWPIITNDEIEAVVEVLKSGVLTTGPKRQLFEEKFKDYIGTNFAVTLSSGTASIHAALASVGVGPGSEVILPAYSFTGTLTPILALDAIPIFVDCEYDSFNLDPNKILDANNKKTKVIIPVHLFGQTADMDPIKKIAKECNLIVIEDAAQSHGAEYYNVKAGNLGKIGCFSFHSSKNMFTGEGGMVTTNDQQIAEFVSAFRHQGGFYKGKSWPPLEIHGYKYELSEMQSAIGIVQLKKLDKNNELRIKNAHILNELLKDINEIELPLEVKGRKHVYHLFPIKIKLNNMTCEEFINKLRNKEIPISKGYARPLYKEPVLLNKVGRGDSNCPWICKYNLAPEYSKYKLPITEQLCKEVAWLHVYPGMEEEHYKRICSEIKGMIKSVS
jgi:dTDP-4-amino-4,6-dideoxygalactose transaminase